MSVYLRKNGTWVCEYYENVEGKRTKRKESFGKGQSGELAARARNAEIKQGKIKLPKEFEGPEFKTLVDGYIKEKFQISGGMSASDQDNTFIKLEKIILPYFGGIPATRFDKDLINIYVEMRSSVWKDKEKTKKIKLTTVHRELSIVRAVLNWAVASDPPLLKYNPIAQYRLPKRDDEIILPPTREERQKIYNNAAPHLKRFIILNYNSGARSGKSELLRINWEHVNFDRKILTVISGDKGGPKLRRIPISDELLEFLRVWQQEDIKKRKLEDPSLLTGPIVHYKGRPIDKINKAWKSALTRAGITRRIRPYDLRHAFATDLLEEGGELKAVSKMMGHSREDTTLRFYRHVTGDSERNAVSKLPRAVAGLKLKEETTHDDKSNKKAG